MSTNPEWAKKLVTRDTTLFWFRRDLRIEDNTGLYHALKERGNVLPLFIFDTNILEQLDDPTDARVTFIYDCLERLRRALHAAGSTLLTLHGKPEEIFRSLEPLAVYTNHDYEPYGCERDAVVAKLLRAKDISFHSYKDIVIFGKDDVVKEDRSPYTVFTPYSRKWKAALRENDIPKWKSRTLLSCLKPCAPAKGPSLVDLGFSRSPVVVPDRKTPLSVIRAYDKQRDIPAIRSTTRLGVHLRFGTVSIRDMVRLAQETSEVWLNELIWREFYHMILWHFPHVATRSFKPAYERIVWRNNPAEFQKWCEGKTGYPIVDAGMRELNATGFMHNRARMIVASFLTKHLLIDWRWGEAYFAGKLLDYDLAANNGGWQWAAGTGCDAAPYFRVFNPYSQAEKFDPDMQYILTWVPEIGASTYPPPLVDHPFARKRALEAYKAALQ